MRLCKIFLTTIFNHLSINLLNFAFDSFSCTKLWSRSKSCRNWKSEYDFWPIIAGLTVCLASIILYQIGWFSPEWCSGGSVEFYGCRCLHPTQQSDSLEEALYIRHQFESGSGCGEPEVIVLGKNFIYKFSIVEQRSWLKTAANIRLASLLLSFCIIMIFRNETTMYVINS